MLPVIIFKKNDSMKDEKNISSLQNLEYEGRKEIIISKNREYEGWKQNWVLNLGWKDEFHFFEKTNLSRIVVGNALWDHNIDAEDREFNINPTTSSAKTIFLRLIWYS